MADEGTAATARLATLTQRSRPGRRPRLRLVLLLGAALAVSAGTVTGCSQAPGHSTSPPTSGPPASRVSVSPSPALTATQSASSPREYSSPQFCVHSIQGFPCLSIIGGSTATGAGIQVARHAVPGNPGSTFMATAVAAGQVGSDSPFGTPSFDQAYAGWHVVEFEAAPGGRPSGQCISTRGSVGRDDADGQLYYPVRLVPCDPSSDDNATWAVWNHNGSLGHPVIMVALTNTTGSPQRLSCVMSGMTGRCAAGALVAATGAGPTISWAHFAEAR